MAEEKTIAKLGIDTANAQKTLESLGKSLQDVAKHTKAVTDETKKLARFKDLEKIASQIEKIRAKMASLDAQGKNKNYYDALNDSLTKLVRQQATLTSAIKRNSTYSKEDEKRLEAVKERARAEERITIEKAKQLDKKNAEAEREAAKAAREREKEEKEIAKTQAQQKQLVDQIFKRMVQMVALRAIRTMWREATQYATEYYDKLNEIRLVTGKTQQEANALGQQYRDLAEDLHVTSTELVSSVASLYRQGLGDEEVRSRLEQITQFATVAGIEVEEATRLMTSSINNFTEEGEKGGDAAKRIADTYANYGDRVATTAEDIATAMTKTAASASNVGVTLERTAAYASTILAVTQDEAESVGNALNTTISRYSRITKTGFGRSFEFDGETVNVNDVAQALSEAAGISIFNYDTGKFADFGTVLDQLAAKWDTLEQRERNYIATQLAGTRQYNRVLTLMQNYDMAMGLLESSYTDTGTVAQKYAVWTESVAAAQNNLKNSLEQLYSVLNGEYLKSFYNGMASVVDIISAAMKVTDGLPLKIGAVGAALVAAVAIIYKVVTAVQALTAAMNAAKTATEIMGAVQASMGGWIALVGVAAAAITAVVGLAAKADQARIDASNEAAEQSRALAATLDSLSGYEEDIKKASTSESPADEIRRIRNAIVDTYPDIARIMGIEKDDVDSLAMSYENLAEQTMEALRAAQLREIREAYTKAAEGREGAVDQFISSVGTGNLYGRNKQKYIAYQENLNKIVQLRQQQNEYNKKNNPSLYDPDIGTARYFVSWNYSKAESQISDLKAANEKLIEEARTEFENAKETVIRDMLGFDTGMDVDLYNAKYEYLRSLISFEDFWGTESLYGTDKPYTVITDILSNALDATEDETLKAYGELQDRIETIKKRAVEGVSEEEWEDYLLSILEAAKDWEALGTSMDGLGDSGLEGLYALKSYNEYLEYIGATAQQTATNLDNAGSSAEAAASKFDEAIAKMRQKRDATNASTSGYSEQRTGFFGAALGFTDDFALRHGKLDSTIIPIIQDALDSGDVDLQGAIDYMKKLYDENADIAEGMMEEFPALAEFIMAGESATIDQLRAVLEEFEGYVDDTAQSILDSYNREKSEKYLMGNFALDWMSQGFDAAWASLKDWEQEYLAEQSDAIAKALEKSSKGIEDTADEWNEFLGDSLEYNVRLAEESGKYFEGTADAVKNAAKGGKEWASSYGAMAKQARDLANAEDNLKKVQAGARVSAEERKEAMSELAAYTGMATEDLESEGGLAAAEAIVQEKSEALRQTLQFLSNQIYDLTGIRLNPGNITSGLEEIRGTANSAAIAMAELYDAMNLVGVNTLNPTTKTKDNRSDSTKKTTVKSGGGGGGGGSKTTTSAAEKLITRMTEGLTLSDHARELAQQAQAYYEVRRELQGVIRYQEVERRLVEEENVTLQGYLTSLEEQMRKTKQGSEDFQKLAAQHQEYSLRLLKNKTDVENLTKAIKEQHDKIRQMEIDLRNTVLQAIEDREAREERMLNGRIKMENEMLALLKKRYEKERDEILETADLRKQALEDEKSAINELLNARKKQEKSDERLEKIAELEAKISRITADPTRQKEAASLREELSKLRNELAWEEAENEADAQKKALDEQITNIEDYKKYVQDYYEELLNNPRKMIEEVSELLESTDEQMLEWLKANSEEYQKATDATQKSMVDGWQSTLMDMRGSVEVYWDEVESIIAQGDDAIIAFLKEHSAAYAEAGKLQAQAYVDEWMDQLEALHLAYKVIEGDITPYSYSEAGVTQTTVSSKSKSSSSSSKSGSKSSSRSSQYSPNSLKEKMSDRQSKGGTGRLVKESVQSMYANGGYNTYTGLALLHGTPEEPEAVLNPAQTKLFQGLVSALEAIPRISVPGFGRVGSDAFTGGASVGDVSITVNVNSLDSDTDIEDAANKLGNAFLNRIQKGMSVSGVRFGNA